MDVQMQRRKDGRITTTIKLIGWIGADLVDLGRFLTEFDGGELAWAIHRTLGVART